MCSPPQPTPGLPGLVKFILPEAGKPAAGWGGVGGGGSSWRKYLAQQQRPPSPALPHKGGGSRPSLPHELTPFNGTPYATGQGLACQISAAYCAMVRSLENFPEPATLRMALRA